MNKNNIGSLAIIGGGPAALLLLKNIIDQKLPLEKNPHLREKQQTRLRDALWFRRFL
jgi:hypothetical protein